MGTLKQALRAALASRRLTWLGVPLTRGGLCILTFHRFGSNTLTGMRGMDPDLLDAVLSRLRRDGYRLVDLRAAADAIERAEKLSPRSVVFTVDDGYADFEQGAEVFLHHGCPVTVFLTTGFIDGAMWLWWDELEYCCLNAPAGEYSVKGGPDVIALTGDEPEFRISTAERLWEYCKLIAEPEKQRFIKELADATGVSLPRRPLDAYAPLTWDKIRLLEDAGIRFAPHTVTHPILSRVDNRQAEFEITESWRRVQQEVGQPTPFLAYPNGKPEDFGEREFRILGAAGLVGAVTTTPGYASNALYRESPSGRFTLPRLGRPRDPDDACLKVCGFDRLPRPWR